MPKKNNPGCLCCGTVDCKNRCLYKCEGTPCVDACAIRIQAPTPDDVSQADGPSCPPSECTITAKCQVCKKMFDGYFRFGNGGINDHPGWSSVTPQGDCSDYSEEYFWLQNFYGFDPSCWSYNEANCPYITEYEYIQCFPQYSLTDITLKIQITYDGSCSETTVTIEYTVVEACDSVAIPPNPPMLPETTYTHVYRRSNQCNCDEILGSLAFISTTVVNNARGITVPDVCNMDSATIDLVGSDQCVNCHCFDCFTPGNQRTLTVTGGEWAGTYILSKGQITLVDIGYDCFYTTVLPGFLKDGVYYQFTLIVECFPCEVYTLTVYLTNRDTNEQFEFAKIEYTPCADPIILDSIYDPEASVDLS